MKLSDYKQAYQDLSGKASDIARQLSFAGIALVWLFKHDTKPIPTIPEPLILPSGLLALALAFDLLHYISGALIWGIFHRVKEKSKIKSDPDLTAPAWCNWPALFFFWFKLLFVIVAYFFIVKYIFTFWL